MPPYQASGAGQAIEVNNFLAYELFTAYVNCFFFFIGCLCSRKLDQSFRWPT